MKSLICRSERACVCVMFLSLPIFTGCGDSGPRVVPDLPDASAPHKAMVLHDTNNDGFLDAKELEQVPGLKAAFKSLDSNHDGKISEQEIADRLKLWADSQIGRLGVSCRVRHNGKPLPGAKVVFVPEKFLGGTIRSGSGTTSKTGCAAISCPYAPNPAIQGLALGFYRVEITKDGENIPAKYNTATTLGAEISNGPDTDPNGLNFDLQY